MEKFFHVYYYESNKYLYGEDYPLTPNFELICMDLHDNICIDLQKLLCSSPALAKNRKQKIIFRRKLKVCIIFVSRSCRIIFFGS